MFLEHLPDLVEKYACLRPAGLLDLNLLQLLSGADKDFTLRKEKSQKGGKSGDTGTSPKLFTPAGARNKVQIHDGGDEVPASVALLHDTAGKTTSLDGEVFESRRGG